MILDPNLWKDIPDDILFDLKNALAEYVFFICKKIARQAKLTKIA